MMAQVMLDDIVYQVARVWQITPEAQLIIQQVLVTINSLNVSVVENIRAQNNNIELTVTLIPNDVVHNGSEILNINATQAITVERDAAVGGSVLV